MKAIKSLSILIPVYNRIVIDLVNNLYNQASASGLAFEILCYDDFSSPAIRRQHSEYAFPPKVAYRELERNYGRSAIRNLLASEARYDHLLFLDCDSKIIRADFISSYISYPGYKVIIGGRLYSPLPPALPQLYLHWIAGIQKEVLSPSQRSQSPYQSLMFNNILIEKNTFQSIGLDESIKGYGHEDSLFGYILKKRNITVLHINNPVEHESLDTNYEFLAKSREAVRNLAYLVKTYKLGTDTKLFRSYQYLKLSGTIGIFRAILSKLEARAVASLLSSQPRVFWLDLLKLLWFADEMKSNSSDND